MSEGFIYHLYQQLPMWKQLVIFVLMLGVISPVMALHEVGHVEGQPATTTQEATSRFLSAEAQRVIKDEMAIVQGNMETYQDENFQIFDVRMQNLVNDMLMKFVLTSLGAFLIGGASVALLMQAGLKKFAVQRYAEIAMEQVEQPVNPMEEQLGDFVAPELQVMQQPDWHPQPQDSSLGTELGQEEVSNLTQMNAWQAQPSHESGFKSPIETHKEYSQTPYGYDDTRESPVQGKQLDDPLASPEWEQGGKKDG